MCMADYLLQVSIDAEHYYTIDVLEIPNKFQSSRSTATKEFFVVCEFVDMCSGHLFLYMQVIKLCTIMYNKQSGVIDIYTKSNYGKNMFYLMQNDVALETTSTHNS